MTPQAGVLGWVLATGAVIGAFAWLGVLAGYPTLWSPLPAAIVIPMLWLSSLTGGSPWGRWVVLNIAPVLLGATYFFLWNAQLLRGTAHVPWRSRIALITLTALTFVDFAFGWDYGIKYQGHGLTVGLLAVNVAGLALCWIAGIRAIRRPSFRRSLVFHGATGLWFVWLAFPWLGEML